MPCSTSIHGAGEIGWARQFAHHRQRALGQRILREPAAVDARSCKCKKHKTLLDAARIVFQPRHFQMGDLRSEHLAERHPRQQLAELSSPELNPNSCVRTQRRSGRRILAARQSLSARLHRKASGHRFLHHQSHRLSREIRRTPLARRLGVGSQDGCDSSKKGRRSAKEVSAEAEASPRTGGGVTEDTDRCPGCANRFALAETLLAASAGRLRRADRLPEDL